MNNTKQEFADWFYELEGFSFVSERFYDDLDLFAVAHKNKESNPQNYKMAQVMMKKWLEAAFEVGKLCQ